MVIVARFMSQDEMIFSEERHKITVNDIKVKCAKKLNTYAPDISLVYGASGMHCTDKFLNPNQMDGVCCRCPVSILPKNHPGRMCRRACADATLPVFAKRLMRERDDAFWEEVLIAHTESFDEEGVWGALIELEPDQESAREAFEIISRKMRVAKRGVFAFSKECDTFVANLDENLEIITEGEITPKSAMQDTTTDCTFNIEKMDETKENAMVDV